jgi:hypothetical protein
MKGFVDDIEDLTEQNSDFRRVLYTGQKLQLVLMAIEPGEEIGEEVHPDRDQFFRIEKGKVAACNITHPVGESPTRGVAQLARAACNHLRPAEEGSAAVTA